LQSVPCRSNPATPGQEIKVKGNQLSYKDPFDSAPDENVKEVPVVEEKPTVIKSDAVGAGEGKIVSTYKEGAGYDASWTVVHAASVDDWFSIHEHPRFKELLDRQKKVAQYMRGGANGRNDSNASAPSSRAPQGAQEAPGGEKRFCSHGEMVFKSGISKAGNDYKLFSCPAPRQEQCQAQYLK
jgi:hypothetical protein